MNVPERWSKPIFILTVGRTGTTLLLRHLACFPGLTIWGEHGGWLKDLAAAHAVATTPRYLALIDQARRFVPSLQAGQPISPGQPNHMTIEWANGYRRQDLDRAFSGLLLELFTIGVAPTQRWGFKEIRHNAAYDGLLRRLFPEAQFLVIARHPVDVLRSQVRAFARSDVSTLPSFAASLVDGTAFWVQALGAARTCFLHYEDLVREPQSTMARVARFLDEPVPDAISAIAHERPPSTIPTEWRTRDVAAELDALFAEAGATVSEQHKASIVENYRRLVSEDPPAS